MNNEEQKMNPTTQTEKASSPARESAGCCGGPAPEGAEGCCALDASVKSTGGAGCGCSTAKKSCC